MWLVKVSLSLISQVNGLGYFFGHYLSFFGSGLASFFDFLSKFEVFAGKTDW